MHWALKDEASELKKEISASAEAAIAGKRFAAKEDRQKALHGALKNAEQAYRSRIKKLEERWESVFEADLDSQGASTEA